MKTLGKSSEENILLRSFKFFDLENNGYCTPDTFFRAFIRLGVNCVNEENKEEYFKLYDQEGLGKIKYKDIVTEIFTPLEIKRQKMIESPKKQNQQTPKKSILPERTIINLPTPKQQSKIEQSLEMHRSLLGKIRSVLKSESSQMLFDMQKKLMEFDNTNSGLLNIDDFTKILLAFDLSHDQIRELFDCFDPTRTGKISYDDFLQIVHGPLEESKNEKVKNLYDTLLHNLKVQELTLDHILDWISSNGNLTEKEQNKIKDNMILHHDFYTTKTGIITFDEFLDFFEIINIDYPNEMDFDNFINKYFKIANENDRINLNKAFGEEECLELINLLRNILINQGCKGIINLYKNFKTIDSSNSRGVDLNEFTQVIEEATKNANTKRFSTKNIANIFNIYDVEETGIVKYNKFIDDLIKRDLIPKERQNLIREIFNHLDFQSKKQLDINELANFYVKPKEEDDLLPDLLDSFITHHNILRGSRNPLVEANDFVEFYNLINFLFPESKKDIVYKDYVSETWRLNDKSFDEKKNLKKNRIDGLGKQKNRNMVNKNIDSYKTPYGTMKEKINYNMNEQNATIMYNFNKIEDVLNHFRHILIQRGIRGIMSLRRSFMLYDQNASKKITLSNFKEILKKYRFDINDIEINKINEHFGENSNEGELIDYIEFVKKLLDNLNDNRKKILKDVFEKLDVENKGIIKCSQLRNGYNPKENPLVRQNKRNEDELLADFIDLIEYHFNLLNDKDDDNIEVDDIKIDIYDFYDFYKNISVCIEDDKYFEIMLSSEWGLTLGGKYPYQRFWNKLDE